MISDIFYNNVELFKRGKYESITYYDRYQKCVVRLSPKQVQALKLLIDDPDCMELGYGGAARGGKSLLIAFAILLLCHAYPGTRYMLGRKKLTILWQTTLKTFKQLLNLFGFTEGEDYDFDGKNNEYIFANGSEVLLKNLELKPTDTEMTEFGSMELTMGFIDQSEHVNSKIVAKVAERCGTYMNDAYGLPGTMMEAFNPAPGHTKTRYWIPYRNKSERKTRRFVQALPTDNPGPAAQKWVADREKKYADGTMSEVDYQKQVKGNFDYDDDADMMFESEKAIQMFFNFHIMPTSVRCLTCDIALEGADKMVIGYWEGFVLRKVYSFDKTTPAEVFRHVVEIARKHGVVQENIIYDADGMGAMLQSEIPNAIPFKNGASPKNNENYANLKTQCYYQLRRYVNGGKLWVQIEYESEDAELMREDLSAYRLKPSAEGKIMMSSKKDIRKLIGRSSDFSDMLMMRMLPTLVASHGEKEVRLIG